MLTIKETGIMFYIIDHCKRIEEKTLNVDAQAFCNDKDIQDIVCFNVFQIGELAKKLSPEFLSKYNKAPWKQIKGTRDKVGHGYETINMDAMWKIASNEVKPLREYCESILEENK